MKFLFFVVLAFANPSPPEIPETVVKISIYDLIDPPEAKPGPPKYQLPKDYGQRVALLVMSKREALTGCISSLRTHDTRYELEISITSAGSGVATAGTTVLGETRAAAECIQKILGQLSYPPHKLTRAVTVELPLRLQKKVL